MPGAFIRRFTGIQQGTSGTPIQTKRVPCYLARAVVFRVTDPSAEAATGATIVVAYGSNLSNAGASLAGQGYSQRGTLPNTLSFGVGTVSLLPADAATFITHPWCDLSITHGTGFAGPVTVDVDVIYESEAMMQRADVMSLVPSAT